MSIQHLENNRVLISCNCGAYGDCYCDLNIAASTWWRVYNGQTRTLIGSAAYEGHRFRCEWHFDNKHLEIDGDIGGLLFDGSIADIVDDYYD